MSREALACIECGADVDPVDGVVIEWGGIVADWTKRYPVCDDHVPGSTDGVKELMSRIKNGEFEDHAQ